MLRFLIKVFITVPDLFLEKFFVIKLLDNNKEITNTIKDKDFLLGD